MELSKKKFLFFFFFDLSITSVVTRTTCIQRVFVCLNSKFMEKITQYSLIFIIFEIRLKNPSFKIREKIEKKNFLIFLISLLLSKQFQKERRGVENILKSNSSHAQILNTVFLKITRMHRATDTIVAKSWSPP